MGLSPAADASALVGNAVLHPFHRERQATLVTSLWCDVEVMIGRVEHVESTGVSGVGVEDLVTVPEEGADTGHLRAVVDLLCTVVIERFTARQTFRRERDIVVEIEVITHCRDPLERPPEASRLGPKLRQRSARNGDQ